MSSEVNSEFIARQEALERLYRRGSDGANEVSVVASAGDRVIAWVIKVKSLSQYNIYNVCSVEITTPGWDPTEIGEDTQAFNVAEPFDEEGLLAADTYAIMFRVGENNVFFVPV